MSTAIEGFGKQLPPATSYSKSLSFDAQNPAGAPQPASIPAALNGSPLLADTFTPSKAAGILSAALSATPPPPDPVAAFEQSLAPPPYTLSNALPDPNKLNAKPLYAPQPTAFQIRQFDDLLKTMRSITAAVLPNFSYSA